MGFRRIVAALVAGSAVLLGVPGAAAAAPDTLRTYVLPGQAVFPEGVTVLGGIYYATSTNGGAVYRGDLRTDAPRCSSRPGSAAARSRSASRPPRPGW